MKEKIIQILKQYNIPTHLHGTIVIVIDKLNKEEIDKRVAFEVACNPDLLEAQTNYKLYESEIKQLKEIITLRTRACHKFTSRVNQLKEIIQAQDEWITATGRDMTFINGGEYITPPSYKIHATNEMWNKITKLKQETGL